MPSRATAISSKDGTPELNSPSRGVNGIAGEFDASDKPVYYTPSFSTTSIPSSHKRSNTSVSSDLLQNGIAKPNFTSRRRQSSIPKIPMGPRPLDFSSNKRSVSNSIVQQFNTIRGASAVASQDPYTNQFLINDISRFSYTPAAPKPQTHEEEVQPVFSNFMEPSFNFDAFHDNITLTEPNQTNFPFPAPTEQKRASRMPEPILQPDSEPPASPQRNLFAQPGVAIPARKASGGVVLSRKASSASSDGSRRSSRSDTTSNNPQSILRGRRQSGFPPNSFNNPPTIKPPRKSIGPGTFIPPEPSEKPENSKRLSVLKPNSEAPKTGLSLRLLNRKSEKDLDDSKPLRASKTKSFLGGSKKPEPNNLLTPSKTPDRPRSSGNPTATQSQTTSSRPGGTPGRTTTPGASTGHNRRMSIYATGLGARTVSPTDARRLKRMSMVPPAPPIPNSRISQAPPTPQPEPMPARPRSTAQSPAASNRKSLTPSSSRTTPDPNPSSRLPTLKPRLDTSSSNNTEVAVPPVPAIPKAYESPGSDVEGPFFSARSSSLPPVDTPVSASPLVTTFAEAMNTLDTPRAPSTASRISSNVQIETEQNQQVQAAVNKRNTESLQLPPINLLPISTPTASKIKSLKEGQLTPIEPPGTPSGMRNHANTPSTPMTASKATFFAKSQRTVEDSDVMRSSTSHHALRPNALRPPSDMGNGLPVFTFEQSKNARNISPFVSTSMPKDSGEFANHMRSNFTDELARSMTQPRPSGPRAPSFSVTPKPIVTESPVEKSSDSESIFSASALRRKLSRKRSESKTGEQPEQTEDLAKYDNMPPPKMPASAAWTSNSTSNTSPVQRNSFLRSRRQASTSSFNPVPERHDSFDSSLTHVSGSRPSVDSTRSIPIHSHRSGSISSISLLNNKSTHSLQQDSGLDRDDLVAEEEMKKLAAKRKDFESAARELDGLRARARPAQRMSPSAAAQSHSLNLFERGEIVDYPEIYYTGTKNAQKIIGDLSNTATNFGYDDDRGDYNIIEGDHLCYRYEVIDLLGKGSFGQVVRCIDHKTGILVAVKIIRNKKRFHQQALVEVNILQKLKEWDPAKKHSVVNFDQSFYFRGHLCISTDLLGMNLYEFIKAHDFRGFSLKLIRRFTKQLLSSLVLLHKHKVIHCDLKPENILLAHPVHSEIKVIDFGSSCFENEKVYTYIQSRFYRSPEVILGMSYGMPIDMWSVGCILAELYTGYPIFPGENEQEQLACIMEVFGPPEKHLIEKSSRKKLFFDSMGKPRLTVSSKGRRRRPSSKDLRQVLKCDDEAFLDFIARCLRWDPARRMNPHDANRHEFITGVKLPPPNARRNFATAVSSPIKRVNSITSANSARPLPQPPSSGIKTGVNTRPDNLGISPMKGNQRRLSNMNAFQSTAQAKRASHVAMSTSSSTPNLNRIQLGQRSMSTRADLATAAAAASLVK